MAILHTRPQIPGLSRDALMVHMRALCQGPRPPASPQEYQAGEYVKDTLAKLGLPAPTEQPFKSQNSFGWISIPTMLVSALAIPVSMLGGTWGRLAGVILILIGLFSLRSLLTAAPPFFAALIRRWPSRNLFLSFPPSGEPRRRLFLVGHLDSQKQRFLAPLPWPRFQSLFMGMGVVLGVFVLLALLFELVTGWAIHPTTLWVAEGMLLLSLLGSVLDELQPHIVGANDNATAVSILLGMAQALRAQPLENTEVTLLFTGCEEVTCVGMEAFLDSYGKNIPFGKTIPNESSFWIDLEMVGTGNLCYVTRHGMTALAYYRPHPEMLRLAGQAALKQPHLGVTGKPMLILEEVANLRRRGYKAICIAGYDEQGFLPNWHRLSDNLDNIEPETLERAAQFTWALIMEVDGL